MQKMFQLRHIPLLLVVFYAKYVSAGPLSRLVTNLEDKSATALINILNINRAFLRPFSDLTDELYSLKYGKYTPITKPNFDDEYDYIIVGAGSGGSALAGRLSEKSCVKILLLEAGSHPSFFTQIPILSRFFYKSDIDWDIQTMPQKNTAAIEIERRVPISVGKAVGGSSAWNAMLNIRGNRKNYDSWANEGGATGWSYKDVLPYFLKMDDNRVEDFKNRKYHNVSGPVPNERPSYDSDYKQAILESATAAGYPTVDSNAENQYGIFNFGATMRNGHRCSAAKAYLVPADGRKNLDIVTKALVSKVEINEEKRAVGVHVIFNNETRFVKARQEVIVSAGTVHTPQVLMLSGIGPRAELERLKIPVIADLPVGENFHDHPGTFLPFVVNDEPFITKIFQAQTATDYLLSNKGPLTSTDAVNVLAFLSKTKNVTRETLPDYQLYFIEGAPFFVRDQFNMKPEEYKKYYGPYDSKGFVWCVSNVLNPKSRGTITLNTTNIKDAPLVDPKYFSHPEDVEVTIAGLKTCQEILSGSAFRDLNPQSFSPEACKKFRNDNDKFLACMVETDVFSFSHPAGTAKMGAINDPKAVVDPELRVRGIQGLRVVDASIMPNVTSGNTNVPTMMIGEKASDMIKKNIKCEPKCNLL